MHLGLLKNCPLLLDKDVWLKWIEIMHVYVLCAHRLQIRTTALTVLYWIVLHFL